MDKVGHLHKGKLIIPIMVCLTMMGIISCRHSYSNQVYIADSLSVDNPKQAVEYTDSVLRCCGAGMSESVRMKLSLLELKARNTAMMPLESDSMAKILIAYYDKKEDRNERMLAMYILGCIYLKQGNYDLALDYYQKAILVADKTTSNINCWLLARLHAHVSDLLYWQADPRGAMLENNKACRYAWLDKDTLYAISSFEQNANYYTDLGMLDSAINTRLEAHKLFLKYGYRKDAAISVGPIIGYYLQKRNFVAAKFYIDYYIRESGLFDNRMNIEPTRGYFNVLLGNYYIGINKEDSAFRFFHKSLDYELDFQEREDVYTGLSALFKQRNIKDSALYYSEKAKIMADSVCKQYTDSRIVQTQAAFNYKKHKAKAIKEKEKRTRMQYVFAMVICICICVIFILMILAFNINKRRKQEKNLASEKAYKDILYVDFLQSKIKLLTEKSYEKEEEVLEKQRIIMEKMKQMNSLYTTISNYERLLKSSQTGIKVDNIIFSAFKEMSAKCMRLPSSEEWNQLFLNVENEYPSMCVLRNIISLSEYRIAILVKLNFTPGEIATLTDCSKAVISNTRRRLYRKLTQKSGSPNDFDVFIKSLK